MKLGGLVFVNNIRKRLIIARHISTTNYCIDIIRKYDYENYICSLLLNTGARSCAIAVRAFNVEVARLQDQVSNLEMGNVRFKFWEDAIERCFTKTNMNKIPNHPVVLELYRVLQKNKLTKRHLLTIVNSRRNIMSSGSLQTIEEMEEYAERTASAVLYLTLEGGDVRSVHADHAASHLGKAQGLCQLLRGVPVGGNASRLVGLPRQLLVEHKVSEEDVMRSRRSDALREVVFHVAARANQHLRKARSLADSLSSDAKVVLLLATPVHNYLQQLLRVDCDLFAEELRAKNYMWIPHVWYKRLTRTY